jgi:hypothetical protein
MDFKQKQLLSSINSIINNNNNNNNNNNTEISNTIQKLIYIVTKINEIIMKK